MSLHESVAALTQLSDRDLWTSALSANGERRRATAFLLARLAVIEARELHLLRGYSSMFDFCVRGLGMSEGTAHRAISGTRTAHRYPLVLEMLADGRLHLSGDAPAGARPRVEPLSEERFAVHLTASARLRDKLEHARNLMSHVSRELAVVIERALDALIRELENKQWGKTDRPRRSRGTKDGSPGRKDKREVYERDDAQCAYVSEDGVRCTSKAFLQYDHTLPRALGGSGKAGESRLLCQQHNLNHAKQIFGREPVERAIDLRQRKTGPAELDPVEQKRQKLLAALTAQGFKKTESKQVVANVARDATILSMEELLRRAFALLVPG